MFRCDGVGGLCAAWGAEPGARSSTWVWGSPLQNCIWVLFQSKVIAAPQSGVWEWAEIEAAVCKVGTVA